MGNSQSGEEVGKTVFKKVCSTALAISYFTPAAVITVPATIGVVSVGIASKVTGHLSGDDDLEEFGDIFTGIATDAALDGISAGSADGIRMSKKAIQAMKLGCDMYGKTEMARKAASGEVVIPSVDAKDAANFIKHFL